MNPSVAERLLVQTQVENDGDWDRFVDSAEGSTVCHRLGWREIMTDVLGHECAYLVARSSRGTMEGVLPLVRMRSRLFGNYAISLPFLNDGGPLGEPSVKRALIERAVELARDWRVQLLELRARQPVAGALQQTDRKISVHLPLPGSREALWKETFRAKLRSQVRRPIKEGMETRLGVDQLLPFYDVFSRNMRDLGTPVHPRAFFERVADLFASDAVFAVVYHQGTPVAAGCGFVWRNEFEITWASALREYNSLSPNMLLYSSLMEHMIDRGVSVFNFGRCTPGGGTHRFKQQWGGADVPLPWARWSADGGAEVPSAERPVFQLATAAWQRLPLPVANRLGPLVCRRIASY